MIAPPRCTVDGCTATALHHHHCLTSFDQAVTFARERVGVHRREVS